jgi:hypothetical protein
MPRTIRIAAALFAAVLVVQAVSAARKRGQQEITKEPVLFSDRPDAEESRVFLPVLEDGPGKGYTFYYKAKLFDVLIDRNGVTFLRLKNDKGEYFMTRDEAEDKLTPRQQQLNTGLWTWWRKPTHYDHRQKVHYRSVYRYMTNVTSKVTPSNKPSSQITIKATLMDGVEFIRIYKFRPDGVEFATGFRCKNDLYPSHFHYGTSFKQCMSFKPSVEQEDRVAALKGYTVTMRGIGAKGRKERQTYQYSDNFPFFQRALEIDATGPWENRHVILSTKKPTMHPHLYTRTCPYQGYSVAIYGTSNNSLSLSKHGKFKLKIE